MKVAPKRRSAAQTKTALHLCSAVPFFLAANAVRYCPTADVVMKPILTMPALFASAITVASS